MGAFECKADDDTIPLKFKEDKKFTCEKINRKQWCDKKVTDEGDKTAAEFCTSCGCIEGPDPGPSPPDEDCKDDTDKIRLTNQEKKLNCKQIKQKELCGEKVKNEGDKTAVDFCTSCGCESGGDPTPSPPDDDCTLGDSDTLQLT